MGSLKKFDGSSWINSNLRKLTTDTDTFTTFPAIIYAEETNATVGLKGNTVQPGTPTPDTPIMPQGTGERTGNLFNPYTVANGYYTSDADGTLRPAENNVSSDYIEVEGNTNYYITPLPSGNWGAWYDENKTYISSITGYNVRKSPANAKYARLTVSRNNNPDYATNFMIAKSSVSIPYEPYGYKIPISSANTTTPVYLGEVETTRKIKKLVFDGTENVTYNSKNDARERWVVTIPTPNGTTTPENVICTHFNTVDNATKPLSEGGICMRITGGDVVVGGLYTDIDITSPSDSTTIVNAVKAYLAAQYAAGTPVTVWYVLATPETAVVNEPLMRIGDYADTVSGISIPVTAGGDTLSVGTTVQPSEVTANYYGWHTIMVHERESGQWD